MQTHKHFRNTIKGFTNNSQLSFLFYLLTRQWPEVPDFVVCSCTLRKSKILLPCEIQQRESRESRFSHGRRFFDSLNVQKSVTQI